MSKTIYDIAKAAGVSIATVSRVFNQAESVKPETREKVLKVVDEMGYHPHVYAQGLASKKKNRIVMLAPVMSNYFFTEVLKGIQDSLAEENYELNIVNIGHKKDAYNQVAETLKKRWAEGYLLVSLHFSEKELKALQKFNVPVCLVDDFSTIFDSVSFNNEEGAYLATEYLIEKGFKRIAILSAKADSIPIRDRLKGYKRALDEHGIEFSESLVVTGDDMARDGFTELSGYEAMNKILAMDPLSDAVFCTSDTKAVGAQKALKEHKVDLPLISFDNLTISEYIGLSTVNQPMYDMGFRATNKLIQRLHNPDLRISNEVHHPELVIRSSTENVNEVTT
ncbi:LacI family DNA-binding transcriptional regulator [Rhodohalobacter halophilus]|uniref:LacI family DNA-binding transcriptional regulator n=1 Tax=Rhodohalobacter halophilus TaxID=1812810 RepID=UPI00083F9091|nr:LacI family DNA-binding transcriptional regulator [Rhodohalobacter halophilus]